MELPDQPLIRCGNVLEPQDLRDSKSAGSVGLETSRGSDDADRSDARKEWAALHLAFAKSRDDASKESIICSMGHFIANLDWRREQNQSSNILKLFLSTVQKACSPAEAPSVRLCGQQALQQSGQFLLNSFQPLLCSQTLQYLSHA